MENRFCYEGLSSLNNVQRILFKEFPPINDKVRMTNFPGHVIMTADISIRATITLYSC